MTSWTSVQPSLLTYFQALRICLFPLKAPRQRDRKSERRSSAARREWNMSCSSCNKMSSPWGQSPWTCHIYLSTKWTYATTQRSYPALQTSVRPYLRHLPYIQFASRFGFTPLILSEKAGEKTAEGNSREVEEVGKWVRGLRPKRRQLPPSAPRSSSRILHVALAFSLRCAGDSWWGTYERFADWFWLYCTSQGPVCRNVSKNRKAASESFSLGRWCELECWKRSQTWTAILRYVMLTYWRIRAFLFPTDVTDQLLLSPSAANLLTFDLPFCKGCAHGQNLAKRWEQTRKQLVSRPFVSVDVLLMTYATWKNLCK